MSDKMVWITNVIGRRGRVLSTRFSAALEGSPEHAAAFTRLDDAVGVRAAKDAILAAGDIIATEWQQRGPVLDAHYQAALDSATRAATSDRGRRGGPRARGGGGGPVTLGDDLFAYLSATLSVGNRVYPLTLPQGAVLPAVVVQLVGGEGPLHSHADAQDGTGQADPSYQRSRVQLGCWADSARGAELLATEVERAVDGFAGSWDGVPVASALVDVSLDDYRPDVRRYRRIIDVLVQWTRSSHGP